MYYKIWLRLSIRRKLIMLITLLILSLYMFSWWNRNKFRKGWPRCPSPHSSKGIAWSRCWWCGCFILTTRAYCRASSKISIWKAPCTRYLHELNISYKTKCSFQYFYFQYIFLHLLVVVDPILGCKLRPHQVEGVKFMWNAVTGVNIENYSGCIMADEMVWQKICHCLYSWVFYVQATLLSILQSFS